MQCSSSPWLWSTFWMRYNAVARRRILADIFLYMKNSKAMDRKDIPKLAKMRFEFSLERFILLLMIELSKT